MGSDLNTTSGANTTDNRNYYNERFGDLSQRLNEEEQRRLDCILNKVRTFAGKNLRIADFGCGRGWLAGALSSYGKVTGFDFSLNAIENAMRSFPECEFVCLNAEDPLGQEFKSAFDLVISSEVIEHTFNHDSYFKNLNCLLSSGGKLLLTTPNGKWKKDFYSQGREEWKQPLENWLGAEELQRLCTRNGFRATGLLEFNSEWIFDFRPRFPLANIVALPVIRKFLKLTGLYGSTVSWLNRNGYGLNLLLVAEKL